MPNTGMLKAKGLHTYNNFYSEIPEGALHTADNVNIDRLSTIESRRGLKQYGGIGSANFDTAKQLLLYKNRILAHYTNSIAYDNGSGTFADFIGSFTETESGLRVKYQEQNGNLYITTNKGIRKISAKSAATLSSAKISQSGGIKAIGGVASPNYSTEGFLEGYSKTAYKVVWGIKDVNNNLILGTPSPAIEVTNQSASSCTVDITFQVPPGVTTDNFYRLYRTDIFTAPTFADVVNLVVDSEYNLVYEFGYVSGTEITVNDIVPTDFRNGGTPLYTNENSGEGILQANEPPPFAKDLGLYKNSLFFANTRTTYKQLIDMLGTSNLLSFGAVDDTIKITGITYSAPNTTLTFSAPHGLASGVNVVILGTGVPGFEGIHTILSVTSNTIVVAGNSTGATAAYTSVYGSSISITKSSTDTYYFVGRPEINTITTPGFYSSINGTYFLLYSADDAVGYVVYFHDTAHADTPPTNSETSGKIFIKVDVTSSDNTGTKIATKVEAAIAAASYDFTTSLVSATITIRNANSGFSTNPVVSTLLPVTGLSTSNVQDGHGENPANKYIRLSSFLSPSQRISDTANSMAKVITQNTSSPVNVYYISGPEDAPGKMVIESRVLDTTSFSIVASDSGTGTSFNPDITSSVEATNEDKPNRVYYSKTSQPEAVPLVNYFDVGPQDKKILRVIGLRDSLFILKEEGVYRLTGETTSSFSVTLFDNSTVLVAPDTTVVMDNQIFCLTSQGISRISETGIDIISQPVQDSINTYTSPRYANFKTAAFACAYTEDYAFIVWLPKLPTDTTGTVAFRFSTKTETWTTWTKTGNARSAIVNPETNKLYIGPDDDNIVEIERKDLRRIDFADREYLLEIAPNAVTTTTIQLSSVTNVTVGDVLVQEQYVTASLVERLSKKFANDPGVPDTVGNNNKDYYRNFTILPGDSLQLRLSDLVNHLVADVGVEFLNSFSSDVLVFQTQFNALVNDINNSGVLLHSNCQGTTVQVDYELFITAVDKGSSTVTVELMQPIVTGPIRHCKAISCTVVYAPYFFGEAALLKHVRDATLVFVSATLTRGTVGYNTDLSANFEDIEFGMEGTGNWGTWIYDSITWGGEGSARPFRTLIPRQKQRCRFVRTRFKHKAAFDEFRLLGISYTFEVNSERAYK